jgi:hypothetical protein
MHEVRHELLCLPDCLVVLMGITFYTDDMAALKLRGPEAKILTLTLHRRKNGNSVPQRDTPEMLELPFKIPRV